MHLCPDPLPFPWNCTPPPLSALLSCDQRPLFNKAQGDMITPSSLMWQRSWSSLKTALLEHGRCLCECIKLQAWTHVISLTLLRSVPYLRLSSSRVNLWSSCRDTQGGKKAASVQRSCCCLYVRFQYAKKACDIYSVSHVLTFHFKMRRKEKRKRIKRKKKIKWHDTTRLNKWGIHSFAHIYNI